MKSSYLIQRLNKPVDLPEGHILHGKDNPFNFGGGLTNGGLSKEAMDLLRPIFTFDYMGAAEFEFGAVPKALSGILKEAKNLVKSEIHVPYKAIRRHAPWEKRLYKPFPKKGVVIVYVLCQKDHLEYVKKLISDILADEFKVSLKEPTRLRESVMERRDEHQFNKEACGWLELDNGFFFFTDQEMFENIAALFVCGD